MKNIALEMIDFQIKDAFPDTMIALVEKIYHEIDKKIYETNAELLKKSPYIKKMTNLIGDRLGLNVVVDPYFSDYYFAAIIPFMSDSLLAGMSLKRIGVEALSDIFGSGNFFKHYKAIEKEKEAYFKRIHNRKGYVNKKDAKLGGYLSEVKHYLLLNFFTLKDLSLTERESVAIILHELGHGFTGLESHFRMETNNSTIMSILNDINDNRKDKAVYKFKKHFDQGDLLDASLSSDDEITDFYGKLAKAYLKDLNSQLINGKYDETNYENLADSFATRFGMGEDIVTGLHKLNVSHGLVVNNRSIYTALLFIDIMSYLLIFVLAGMPGLILCGLLIVAVMNIPNGRMTYDFPIERYNRIKNTIIHQLKDKNLPVDVTKDLLSQYETITSIIEESSYFKGLGARALSFTDVINKNDNYYIALQQTIENSLNNALFVSSQQLRVS